LNERIKKLRKALDLTQQDFANRLGTTRDNIAGYETGRRSPSVAVISLICREFDVSETWLRTGEGDMFIPMSRSDEIAAFVGDILRGEPDFRQRFISVLSRMTTDEWKLLEKKILELTEEIKKADP
jgi:transcriptional regulator with XRE-family HTH domain